MLFFYVGAPAYVVFTLLIIYYSNLLFDPLLHANISFRLKSRFHFWISFLLCYPNETALYFIHELLALFLRGRKLLPLRITSNTGFIQIFASELLRTGFYYTQTVCFLLGSTLQIPGCFFSTLLFLSSWLLKLFLEQAVLLQPFHLKILII